MCWSTTLRMSASNEHMVYKYQILFRKNYTFKMLPTDCEQSRQESSSTSLAIKQHLCVTIK